MSDHLSVMKKDEGNLEPTHQVHSVTPDVDIYENDNEILLYADMPGISKKDLSVNIDNGRLMLTGTRQVRVDGARIWEEFGDAEYHRVFSIPQTIDTAKVRAELSDGVLRLHLPKSEAAKPRQIEIKGA